MNGCIWVYYSSIKVQDEYFTDDKNKISSLDKDEKPSFIHFILIICFRNIIRNLDENDIEIEFESIMRYYNLFVEKFRKDIKKEDKENFRRMAKIDKNEDKEIIAIIKEEIKFGTLKDSILNIKK